MDVDSVAEDQLQARVDELCEPWEADERLSSIQAISYFIDNFKLKQPANEEPNPPMLLALEMRYTDMRDRLVALSRDRAIGVHLTRVERAINTLKFGYDCVRALERGRGAMCQLFLRNDLYTHDSIKEQMQGAKNDKPAVLVEEALLNKLFDGRYKSFYTNGKQWVMEEIVSADGAPTRAWRYKYELAEWARLTCSPQENAELRNLVSGHRLSMDKILESIVGYNDRRFPVLKRDRFHFSFRNGIYNTETNKFWTYEEFKYDLATVNYIDAIFNPALTTIPVDEIQTPALESIMKDQRVPDDAVRLTLAMLGRMHSLPSRRDRWQMGLFFMGLENTGKSEILSAGVLRFYNENDVGQLSANDKTFGACKAAGKMVVYIGEFSRDSNCDRGLFLQLIRHERTEIRKMRTEGYDDLINAFVACTGNSAPKWADNAVKRCLFVIMHERIITVNPRLPDLLRAEMPAILAKTCRLYSEYADRCRNENKSIVEYGGTYFKRTRARFGAAIDRTTEFVDYLLQNGFEEGADRVLLMDQFIEIYREYYKLRSPPNREDIVRSLESRGLAAELRNVAITPRISFGGQFAVNQVKQNVSCILGLGLPSQAADIPPALMAATYAVLV